MTGDASTMRTALTRVSRVPRPGGSGPPIRQLLADRRDLVAPVRERGLSPLAALRHFAFTSPGKLVIICVVLAASCGLVGWYASTTLERRTQTLQEMIERTEPLAEAAQVLYSSLSIADASANAAFISGGLEPQELRQRYADAIATASSSLITAAGGAAAPGTTESDQSADAAVMADLDTLATSIPVYSGLIETARTNNRLGNPVGSAYLGEASSLMQDRILPAAQRLYQQRSSAISDPQRALTVPPWGVYTILVLLIVGLIATSRYLARRTRRRFNIGVLAALIAVLVGTVWLLIAGLMSVAATNSAKQDGADPLRELTTARILTQQARSAETLSLVRRGDQATLEGTFDGSTKSIDNILTTLASDRDASDALSDRQLEVAKAAVARWRSTDARVREWLSAGDYITARTLTVGDGRSSSARAYSDVDAALIDAITTTRSTFRDDINTAQRVLGFSGSGILALTVFAGVAVVIGLIPRIREYR
ncbi:hypothetical protein [Gordonia soli]|uniref:Chemotaxis methyl-accepting receptor HlyB-like 4HB MCP domain-containing protein n=1 Tax=Gordonia soli NBRC 108243 TaxID=1223545 RepID=M0QGG2_9ACTN|nr:hypothetical protein [Gordonia soli]GAC67539.1 hypothetical protein GS4_08_01240 [Gordonia soli NBRC 108243]